MAPETGRRLRFEVKVDGSSELAGPASGSPLHLKDGGSVYGIRVERSLDAPDFFELRCALLFQGRLVDAVDMDLEGKSVEILMGMDVAPELVFRGEVAYVEPVYGAEDGDNVLTISGYDLSHRLTRGTNARTWGDGVQDGETYSDIASRVVQDSGSQSPETVSDNLSTGSVSTTQQRFAYVAQFNTSDYQFLRGLGMDASRPTGPARDPDGRVSFREVDTSGQPVLTICRDQIEGDPATFALDARFRISTVNQYAQVVVRGWDPQGKTSIVGVADSPRIRFDGTDGPSRSGIALYGRASAGRVLQLVDQPVASRDEAEAIAQAVFDRLALDFVTGEATVNGFPGVGPGDLVEMRGFGERFSGRYLVMATTHELHPERGYRTRLQLARNAAPDPE